MFSETSIGFYFLILFSEIVVGSHVFLILIFLILVFTDSVFGGF